MTLDSSRTEGFSTHCNFLTFQKSTKRRYNVKINNICCIINFIVRLHKMKRSCFKSQKEMTKFGPYTIYLVLILRTTFF